MTKEELVKLALAEVGTKEVPSGSNKVKYNKWFYGREVSGSAYPWCAAFVCWLFKDNANMFEKSASCSALVKWFKKNQAFYTAPKVGDLVFFNFSHPNALADHVGIVVEVRSGKIITVEGNTSLTSQDNGGAVMRRERTAKSIVGYGRPDYDDSEQAETKVINYPTLSKGAKGAWVVLLQNCLMAHGYSVGIDGPDGDFGTNTLKALTQFQADNDLTVNGICSRKVWEKLQ